MPAEDLTKNLLAPTRRTLLRALGGGALVTLAGLGVSGGPAEALDTKDINILNFALNLEYLEAEFYLAATGQAELGAADTAGKGAPGETTGRITTVFEDSLLQGTAAEITGDEVAHVKLLRAALGKKAVAKPAILLNPLGSYATEAGFLTYSRAFEDTGVSAYGGAARKIQNKGILQTAARILATETYHAGNIRLFSVQKGVAGIMTDTQDQQPSSSNLFPTDANGLAIIRTVEQVLAIVAPFFPSGLNGAIH